MQPIPFYTTTDGVRFPQVELEFDIQGQTCRFCIMGLDVDNIKDCLVDSADWKYEVLGRLSDNRNDLGRVLMLELSRQKWPRQQFPNPWIILMTPLKKIVISLKDKQNFNYGKN